MKRTRKAKSKTKIVKAANKYPELWRAYVDVDVDFERVYSNKYLGAKVTLYAYKGAVLLQVRPDTSTSAWLRGDDLDAVIGMLREAKAAWLKAYRKAERSLKKPKKVRVGGGLRGGLRGGTKKPARR